MSKVQNLKEEKSVTKREKSKVFCDHVKAALLKIFLLIRYYLDLFIDWSFGYFNDSKRVPINKCTNPIILESVTSLARKIKKRELKSEEVVQAYIDRIKEVNPVLNALVDSRYEAALEDARKIDKDIENGTIQEVDFQERPFLGIPFTTKESSAVEGLSFTLGIVKRKGRKATFDAEYVELIKKAGGICLGVTNVPQLNLWQETHNPVYGVTNNPYNSTRNVGGSSGGEASLLAAGGTCISIGTDIGGSIRIPAFMCGVFGHKPTSNLISTKGTMYKSCVEARTLAAISPLTRYTEDLIPVLRVLLGENIDKLKLDVPVKLSNVRIYNIANPKDFLVSPIRNKMKRVYNRPIFPGTTFRTGKEEQTMVVIGILSRYVVDLKPVLKLLVDENVEKLKLDEPINVQNVKIHYLKDPNDVLISPSRHVMIQNFSRYIHKSILRLKSQRL